jgi:hypothetical protein
MSPATIVGALACVAMPLVACASPASPTADSIDEVRQERDCTGCDSGTVVALRRDGTATMVRTGKARHGTTDRTFAGSVPAADFQRLAALLVSKGFFQLQDEYRDPTVADGSWVTTSAAGDQAKTVVDSNAAGPANLKEIEDAVEAVRASITWSPPDK